eukprot:CAMPEP_0197863256 /NCGR_PEP_ID=MMETSP1438-20131217/40578_1 /TAXON_ID=1461541 /ORGANISM="Pterosperma sp., Strain CCMP1384" /LENGTH=248 /DNA_ID=CAMNT_0043481081 /DNA_START=33 /DNA_END=776 /DNA_ORIENTATION=-
MASWFKDEFGFEECKNFKQTQQNFTLEDEGNVLVSKKNGRRFHIGPFETPTVRTLRARIDSIAPAPEGLGPLKFKNIAGNVSTLTKTSDNAGAVFQAASQFNCLEMVGPGTRPEDGITNYYMDHTQGPACALACPAATLYRNYLCNDRKGQQGRHQLDLLDRVGRLVGNQPSSQKIESETKGGGGMYWNMKNGYCMPVTPTSMQDLNKRLNATWYGTAHPSNATSQGSLSSTPAPDGQLEREEGKVGG